MRLCFVNYYVGPLDDGAVNTAFYLCQELSKRHEVLHLKLSPGNLVSPGFWQRVKSFHPQIIHYVTGPTTRSFMVAKALKLWCSHAKIVMSALQPAFSPLSARIIALIKPDLILTQSYESEGMFASSGCQTKFLPSGVNTQRFTPASNDIKRELRRKYKLPEERFIILHVGSIQKDRNILIFNQMNQDEDNQVIIIGSTTRAMEQDVYQNLKNSGCLVWRTYLENVEELYALADCYIFPTIGKLNSIEMPLSVMEAMSCNLPVISTRYGALTRVFSEGQGLYFAERDDDFTYLLKQVKSDNGEVKTREKVLPYSWENIAQRLEAIYDEILSR